MSLTKTPKFYQKVLECIMPELALIRTIICINVDGLFIRHYFFNGKLDAFSYQDHYTLIDSLEFTMAR